MLLLNSLLILQCMYIIIHVPPDVICYLLWLIVLSYTCSIFLDEPTSGLDAHAASMVVKSLNSMGKLLNRVVM